MKPEVVSDLIIVIMAGGAGTRFWPLSTRRRPKQFLRLFGERTLLQQSFDRVRDLVPAERVLVLTNEDFVDLVREQLPELPAENILGEPFRRDTGAAVTLAALLAERRFGNPIIATLTADHLIGPVDLFQDTLLSAAARAGEGGGLYTFGVRPDFPATAYGYLEIGEKVHSDGDIEHFRLNQFKEKPDAETAARYVESGRFLWNSGMFVWRTDTILTELEQHLPEHVHNLRRAVRSDGGADWKEALSSAFEPLQPISIDFGVMERAREVFCVSSRFDWSDVGGWLALKDHLPSDSAGNHTRGELYQRDSHGNLVFCEDASERVVLIGVEDLVVVHSADRLLVVRKDRAEEIKAVVKDNELD